MLVNFCETLVVQHMGQASQVCVFSPLCGKGLAIEHDGSVYACDHYVYEYRLGNIADQRLGDMAFEPGQVRFGYDKSEALSRQCRKCDFLKDCWGECAKNRVVLSVDGELAITTCAPACSGSSGTPAPQRTGSHVTFSVRRRFHACNDHLQPGASEDRLLPSRPCWRVSP